MSTFYGTGTSLVDARQIGAGAYSCMRWVTFFWLPIFPLEQLVVRPGGKGAFATGGKFGVSYEYAILGREDMDKERINRVYLHSVAGLFLAAAPMIAWIVICNPTQGVHQSEPAKLFGLFSILWIPAVVWYFQHRSMKLFRSIGARSRYD